MENQTVLIVDFGGQYKELIARRVRECGVKSLIVSNAITPDEVREKGAVGLIFTGGPDSAARVGISLVDISTGATAHAAILEALIGRGITGKGAHISVSMFPSAG